jgi:flagellar biosynthetic protein FliR
MTSNFDFASILPFVSLWLIKVSLLSVRIGAVFLMTPILAAASVPVTVRILLVLGLAAALSTFGATLGAVPLEAPSYTVDHPGALVQALAMELVLGATLAVGVHLAFASFAVAGRLLDIQIGFGLGQVLDPQSNAQLPILTTAFNQIGVIVFFLVNGHHALMRGIAYSLERFPAGRPWPIDAAYGPIMKQLGGLLGLSFALTAPVVFCIFMVELALGVLARNLPQINMLTLGIPIKVVVGLIALSLWFTGVGSAMTRVYAGIYQSWTAIFASDASPDGPAGAR